MPPRVVVAGDPVAEPPGPPTPGSVMSFKIASCWKRPMLRPTVNVPMLALPNVMNTWRTSMLALPRAVLCEPAPPASCRFGLPPSLVLTPGYRPRVAAMSSPFCVVDTPKTNAAGRRPLLTDEEVELPSTEVQARPPLITAGVDSQLEWM